MNSFIAGVDIGGSHITAALVNTVTREVEKNTWIRQTVNAEGNADSIFDSWADVINGCFTTAGLEPGCIGIAMPGPFDYVNGISLIKDQTKFRSLYKLNVQETLADRLSIPAGHIRFKNDAACFLQGELYSGVGQDVHKAIGLTLGTGFGSAFMEGTSVVDAGLWCTPFRNGIAEDYFSNRGLVRKYEALSGRKTGSARELAAAAAFDLHAEKTFRWFGTELAEFLLPLVMEKKPEMLIIGGNIAKAFPLFAPGMREHLHEHNLQIRMTVLGEDAALIGAASMWAATRKDPVTG